MKQVFLSDKDVKDDLFPFTLTRSAADLRVGILTLREKWQLLMNAEVLLVEESNNLPAGAEVFPSNAIPDNDTPGNFKTIKHPWNIFQWNDEAIRSDFKLVTHNRHSVPVPESVLVKNAREIFVEEGAKISCCIINADTGPVYIGKGVEIMEGALLRGPLAICDHAVIKMGAKIYGATTIGPNSIVGGEIKNAVIFGNSNKAHDGYLGDSVIGEWCNLGAGTSNSNMKNNVSEVRMWSESQQKMIGTGLEKCGLIMGDYSRAAINTSFNTGTMVGACANVFGGDVPKYVSSFSWGSAGEKYKFEKAVDDISKWMKLKGRSLSEKEKTRLKLIFGE
jgi:UDP-N-acetylglucosamine diphosphorylase/glucosamine-1-phosphate N-acetyltransferase